jgi:hypothetical protein
MIRFLTEAVRAKRGRKVSCFYVRSLVLVVENWPRSRMELELLFPSLVIQRIMDHARRRRMAVLMVRDTGVIDG